jgi:large subunit ribosomal protein L32
MASIALHQTRSLFPTFRSPWARPGFAAVVLPTFLASQKPFNWAVPSLQSLLDLFPPFLLAVPKKKVSHSRKAMRSANKGLKDKKSMPYSPLGINDFLTCSLCTDIVSCPACGQAKLAHHLCGECFSNMKRKWRTAGWKYDVEDAQTKEDNTLQIVRNCYSSPTNYTQEFSPFPGQPKSAFNFCTSHISQWYFRPGMSAYPPCISY